MLVRKPPEFLVHDWYHAIEGAGFTGTRATQQLRGGRAIFFHPVGVAGGFDEDQERRQGWRAKAKVPTHGNAPYVGAQLALRL